MTPVTRTAERVRALADHFGINLNGQADSEHIQFATRAICHGDRDASSLTIGTHDSNGQPSATGYPLLTCHAGCDYANVRAALTGAGARADLLHPASGQPHAAKRSKATPRPVCPDPDVAVVADAVWVGYRDALWGRHRDKLALLMEKGLTQETIRAVLLGWDARRERYTIPIFDADDRCVNIRLYKPGATSNKMINYSTGKSGPSYGRNRLYVPGDILDPNRRTLHCAGEFDAILGWQQGWQTSTQTGGESSRFPTIDLPRMAGQQVVVAYDNDDAGREGAQRTATDLASRVVRLAVADLSLLDLPDKGDLGDVWRRPDLGNPAVRQILAAATPWAAEADGMLRSWATEDLSPVLDGSHEPLQPTVCRRAGAGVALFYPGKIHALASESEAGKTWLALLAAQQEMSEGHHVFFYDFEDDASGVEGRLLAMGIGASEVLEFFHYVRPDEPLSDGIAAALVASHEAIRPTLVIVDGVTEVMTQQGWGQNENNDIAAFYRTVLRPMADVGAAVVALDHLPKSDEKRRGSIGGVHKLNGIDGAMYRLEAVDEIAPGRDGLTRVIVNKDRPGQVKKHQDERKRIADLLVLADDDDSVVVALEIPGATKTDAESSERPGKRITGNGALVLAALSREEERTTTKLMKALMDQGTPVSSTTVKRWLGDLEAMGKAVRRETKEAGKPVHYWKSTGP